MPDTVLPSPASATGGTNAPRMGTPANDSGWAGWAISSFTNKLAAASGQIQTNANGSAQERPSSVPPPVPANKPATNTSATRPGMTLAKSNVNIPTIMSPDPAAAFNEDAEDFSEDWGGFGEDDGFGSTSSTTKQPAPEEDPWGTPSITSPTSTANYDDKGEPDFAGWLAAQGQTKKPGAKPLPKGLAKPGAGSAVAAKRPIVGGRTGSATRKVVVAPVKKEVKKEEEVKSKEDEEEGWGDAW